MDCPACKTVAFQPVKLDGSLPALGCPECDGALVSLLYYRDWTERTGRGAAGDANPDVREVAVRANDTAKALACPKCSRIMTKFRIAGGVSNRIDLCATCDEAWLDGGEWALLQALELSDDLPSILTDRWQLRVKQADSDQRRRERLAKVVSPEDVEQADAIRDWLRSHRQRAALLAYLGQS